MTAHSEQQPIVVEGGGFLADRRDLQLDALAPVGLADPRRRDHVADAAGTTAGWAASGLAASCAVPAGGVAGAAAGAAWRRLGGLAGACAAAAGVSPAAAKAIAHPISLIFTPDMPWDWRREMRAPDLRGSIGAAFRSLKRLVRCNGGC